MKRTLAVTGAAAFAALALATAPIASAGAEEDFLKTIADNGISWPSGKTQQVVDTGNAVCQDWSNGATFNQEVSDLQGATDWSDYQVGVFIGAATRYLCPQYLPKIPH